LNVSLLVFQSVPPENGFVLLQINQLQEELETTYLNAKELKGELVVGASALVRNAGVRSCILHVSLLVLQSAPPENGLALL
jgi:hypothetical protein